MIIIYNMKYIITESQLKVIVEEERKVLHIPDIKLFGNWKNLQEFLESKGNPFYSLGSGLNLTNGSECKTLGSMVSIDGSLDISDNDVIRNLGQLRHVGGSLIMSRTSFITTLNKVKTIGETFYAQNSNLQNLGDLESVGRNCYLNGTPLSRTNISIEDIRRSIDIGGTLTIKKYDE